MLLRRLAVNFSVRADERRFAVAELLRFAVAELRRFAVAELRRFAAAELLRFAAAELLRFAVAELLRFAVAELRRFAVAELRRFAVVARLPRSDVRSLRKLNQMLRSSTNPFVLFVVKRMGSNPLVPLIRYRCHNFDR